LHPTRVDVRRSLQVRTVDPLVTKCRAGGLVRGRCARVGPQRDRLARIRLDARFVLPTRDYRT
jgi:hypothetical protein